MGIVLLVLFFIYCYVTGIIIEFVTNQIGRFLMEVDDDKFKYYIIAIGILVAVASFFFYELSILASLGVGIGSMLAIVMLFGMSFYIGLFIVIAIGSGMAVFTINFFESYKYKLEGGYIIVFVLAYIVTSGMILFFRKEMD